ncbi:MAG: indolepyruvate oxidoreductase subunit beta [Bacillota bacterium]
MRNINILLVGVGGQGTILASKILAQVAQSQGYDVKMTEIHGMAQRGGSVVTQVRLGEKVYSPMIEAGQADYLIAFERLEALRWLHILKVGGSLVVNAQEIEPMTVVTGTAQYPGGIDGQLGAHAANVSMIPALDIAKDLGNIRAVNVVLIGALAKQWDIPYEAWMQALEATVPARYLDLNKKAFEAGYKA